jgi:YfiH family protein
VRAFVTTRAGGVSEGEYASMNLGFSSGDDPARVERNRAIVAEALPSMPRWLRQVHGKAVVDLDAGEGTIGDAAVTRQRARTAGVLTADCLPVFLTDVRGTAVAVAHAGWRGLAAGVVEAAVEALRVPPSEVLAWMGPAIGKDAFEVGPEVRAAFLETDSGAEACFRPHTPGKYMADLYALARRRLARAAVTRVHGGGFCTFHEPDRFFSYRRHKASGRMGSFVWLA